MGGIKAAPSEEEDGGPLTPDTAVLSAAASGESSPVGTDATSNVNDDKKASDQTPNTGSAIPTTPGQHRADAPLTVLFLSSDTGGGHRASAMSLARQFELLHPGTAYQLLDVVTECMPVTIPAVPYPSLFLSSSQTSMTSLLDGDEANAAAAATDTAATDTATAAEAAVEADTDAADATVEVVEAEAAAHDENAANSDEADENSDDDDSKKDSGSENDNNIDSAHDDDDDDEPKEKESESGSAATNSKNKVVGRAKSCLDELSFATEDIDENGGSPLRLLPPRPSPTAGAATGTTGGRPPAFKKSA